MNAGARSEAMAAVRSQVGQVVRRAARDVFGASIVEAPVEGFRLLTCSTLDDPRTGIRAALAVQGIAGSLVGEYARDARASGRSWEDIAEVLGVEDARDAYCGRGELVYRFLVEGEALPGEGRSRFERSAIYWRCSSCQELVTDQGPFESHPSDNESGHTGSCARHAAEVAAYVRERGW